MTPKQESYKKRLITLIHMNKLRVFHSDEERRIYLEDGYGVNSLTQLNITQLEQVADYVCDNQFHTKTGKATNRQCYYLRQEWTLRSQQKDESSLLRFCGRILGIIPFKIEHMDQEQMSKMITAVKHLHRKKKANNT